MTPSEAGRRQPRRLGARRRIAHQVKVTEDVERRLVARAAERHITVSRLLVESALAGGAEAAKTKAELASELFRTNRLLLRAGVNLNQIATATNATGETQPETFAAGAALRRVAGRIDQLLDDLDVGGAYDRTNRRVAGPDPAGAGEWATRRVGDADGSAQGRTFDRGQW